jgi:uncharacterized membrane protein
MDGSDSGGSSEELRHEVEELKRRVAMLEARAGVAGAARKQELPADPTIAQASTTPDSDPAKTSAHDAGRIGQPSALESRIGAQIFNRVGIFAILGAAAWFLKLAIDRAWIGPGLRVIFGLVIAVVLMLWSEWFRRGGSIVFSYTLKALASGIAYLSLWACFNLYHLLPSGVVLLGMAGLTVTNAVSSWKQDSELLAALALAGGLATPALLSTGDDREIFLFSYLLLLDLGVLALVALRAWPRMAFGAFAGTTVYFIFWSMRYYTPGDNFASGCFVALFFALFTAVPFLARARTLSGGRPAGGELLPVLPIALGICAFIEADHLVSLVAAPADVSSIGACVAMVLGAIYLLLTVAAKVRTGDLLNAGIPDALASNRAEARSQALRAVHVSLAVGFVALAALVKFRGYGIDLCWLAELAVLVAAAYLLRNHYLNGTLRGNGAVMLILTFCALLLLRWYDRLPSTTEAFVNAHFATYLLGLAILAGVVMGARQAIAFHAETPGLPEAMRIESWEFLAGFAVIGFNVIALSAVSLQIGLYWRQQLPPPASGPLGFHHPPYVDFTYSAWFMLYGAALMATGFLRHSAFLRWQALILLTLSIGKVFLFDTSHLTEGYRVASFLGLGVLLLAVSFVYQRDLLGLREKAEHGRPTLR